MAEKLGQVLLPQDAHLNRNLDLLSGRASQEVLQPTGKCETCDGFKMCKVPGLFCPF